MNFNNIRNALIGGMIADCMGVTYEFLDSNEITYDESTLAGGGFFDYDPGCWSDDTSMSMCIMESITRNNGINLDDIMRNFCRYYTHGFMSSQNSCYDIGNQIQSSLNHYLLTGEFSPETDRAGNGSLMCILPVIFFDIVSGENNIESVTRLTHNNNMCVNVNLLFRRIIGELIHPSELNVNVNSSTGYVLNSFNIMCHCLLNNLNFTDSLRHVIELGNDTDTNASIALSAVCYFNCQSSNHFDSLLMQVQNFGEYSRVLEEFINTLENIYRNRP